MKNSSRQNLKETAYRHLFEQEEEEEEIFGDTEAEDEAAEEEEAPAAEGEAEDETAEEEEEVEVTPTDQYELSDSIDNELDALMVDFEQEARKSAAVNQTQEDISERVYRRLFESAAEDIDLRSFASNIARLVKNYQNLIDWESVILNKTESFVNNHYGEETVQVLFDILEDEYDIAREVHQEMLPEIPVAVGARTPSG